MRTHTHVRAARRENATVDARCSAGDRMKCAIILCSFWFHLLPPSPPFVLHFSIYLSADRFLFSCPLRRNAAQFRLTYLKGNVRSGEHENIFRNDWRRIKPEDCAVAFPTTHVHPVDLLPSHRLQLLFWIWFLFFKVLQKKCVPTFWQDSLTSLSSHCCVLMWCITAQKALSIALIQEIRSNYPDLNIDWHIDSIVKSAK